MNPLCAMPLSRYGGPKRGDDDARNILRFGAVLNDTFEIRSLLGEGGMGQVYEALDRVLNRRVAIKVAWPHMHVSVCHEARALAALRHPCLVGIHGVWKHEGLEYAVMEQIQGVTLDAYLESRNLARDPLRVDEALAILAAIADGLAAVHRAGMAHRDVKPANVMLAPDNRVVLMDFGIVLPEIEDGSCEEGIAGSPSYMAPEAVLKSVEPGCAFLGDIYALGIVAFELLTGRVPFHGNMMAVLHDHVSKPVPDLFELRPDIPARLRTLVLELLAKDPRERPQAMDSVAWQFRKIGQTSKIPTPGRLSVLIAEDNPRSASVMQELVTYAAPDAEVQIISDGQQALEVVTRAPPHLLLVDLHLPGLNGMEVCCTCSPDPPHQVAFRNTRQQLVFRARRLTRSKALMNASVPTPLTVYGTLAARVCAMTQAEHRVWLERIERALTQMKRTPPGRASPPALDSAFQPRTASHNAGPECQEDSRHGR